MMTYHQSMKVFFMRRCLLAGVLLLLILAGTLSVHAQDDPFENLDLTTPIDPIETGDTEVINIMLMGSATRDKERNPALTDSLMIVSVQPDTGHIAVISIPRDLYVYAEGYGHHKINQIYFYAEMSRSEERTGFEVLANTIEHNLGLTIDYYARVDFTGFGNLIDSIGGVDIAVDCAIKDWRLKDPELDRDDPDNWEMVTMWAGLHHMDGDTALWYVRSRRTSTDIDRGRRQQDVMRAVWRTIRADGLLENFPSLWEQFNAIVETDMQLEDALTLLPVARELSAADVEYVTFRQTQEVIGAHTPDEGRFVLVPQRDAITRRLTHVVAPPNRSRITREAPTVAIYNGSGIDYLEYVAAQRLEREGFQTVITGEWTYPRNYNRIVDHVGAGKGNPVHIIADVLRVTDEGIANDPDPARDYDYEVHIGNQYQFYSCTFPVQQPDWDERPTPTPTGN